MIEYLKKSKPEIEKLEDDKKVRSSVEELPRPKSCSRIDNRYLIACPGN